MERRQVVRLALIVVGALLLLGGSVATLGAKPAAAGLGNTGVPVRCFKPGAALAPGGQTFLTCIAASGPAFVGNQRVPNGHYFLVTDVLITPDAGANATGIVDLTFFDAYGTDSRQSSFRLRTNEAATFGFNFSAPYFVLQPDHRLEVTSAASSAYGAEIRVSGFLVTNVDFIPMALK